MKNKSPLLEAAKIINTHGISGELKLESLCDDADILCGIPSLFIDGKEYAVLGARAVPKGFVLARLDGVNGLDDAMKLKGKYALARREHIQKKDGAHFIADIIGLPVIDKNSGKVYGELADVMKPASQELFCIKTPSGGVVMMPNVPSFVSEVDEERGVFVTPIDGFFNGDGDEV